MSEGREDRILEEFLKQELRALNSSLPVKRLSLRELLEMDIPYVRTRDGGVHMFRKSELRTALEVLGEDDAGKLLLPIILEMRVDLSETVAVVHDEIAVKLLSRLLKLSDVRPPLYLYPIHLNEVRRKVGTLIQYAVTLKHLT